MNATDATGNGHGELVELREHTRVMLQPIAAPAAGSSSARPSPPPTPPGR